MPNTNIDIVFMRMRIELTRLAPLARTQGLKDKLSMLRQVYTVLEQEFADQPPVYVPAKPLSKARLAEQLAEHKAYMRTLWAVGEAAYNAGAVITDNPEDTANPILWNAWQQGWLTGFRMHTGNDWMDANTNPLYTFLPEPPLDDQGRAPFYAYTHRVRKQ